VLKPVTSVFQPRRVYPLEVWRPETRVLKIYSVELEGRKISKEDVVSAKKLSEGIIASWEREDENTHGLGFIALHMARDYDYLLVQMWTDNNIMRLITLYSPCGGSFRETAIISAGCVWELAVICHERSAWLRHMLRADSRPDPAAWEADLLDGRI